MKEFQISFLLSIIVYLDFTSPIISFTTVVRRYHPHPHPHLQYASLFAKSPKNPGSDFGFNEDEDFGDDSAERVVPSVGNSASKGDNVESAYTTGLEGVGYEVYIVLFKFYAYIHS